MANSQISPWLIRWAFLIESSQSSRMRLEIPEAEICCGSAGIYNLVQPEAATQLGDRKSGHVAALDADMVVSSNPGCLLQLQSALPRVVRKLPVRHIVELLDASIRGLSM